MESFEEREAQVARLKQEFGSPSKVNLVYDDGSTEGVWAVFCDKDSKKKYGSTKSQNEKIHMRLVNHPLGWANALWGMKIVAYTQGEGRPEAYEKENYEVYLKEYEESKLAGS